MSCKLIHKAYEEYSDYMKSVFEPDHERGSIEAESEMFGRLIEGMKGQASSKYQLDVIVDLIQNGDPREKAMYLGNSTTFDFSEAMWQDPKSQKCLLSDHDFVACLGQKKLVNLIEEGFDVSPRGALAALTRPATLDLLSGEQVASFLTKGFTHSETVAEDTAGILMMALLKMTAKMGVETIKELFDNPKAMISQKNRASLLGKINGAAKGPPPLLSQEMVPCY